MIVKEQSRKQSNKKFACSRYIIINSRKTFDFRLGFYSIFRSIVWVTYLPSRSLFCSCDSPKFFCSFSGSIFLVGVFSCFFFVCLFLDNHNKFTASWHELIYCQTGTFILLDFMCLLCKHSFFIFILSSHFFRKQQQYYRTYSPCTHFHFPPDSDGIHDVVHVLKL